MRRFIFSMLRDRAGAAAIEFGFISVFFVTALMGIFEFGRGIWSNSALQFAVEEGGRYALAHPTATDLELRNFVINRLSTVTASDVIVTVARDSEGDNDFVALTAAYPFRAMIPFINTDLFTLTGRTRVLIQS